MVKADSQLKLLPVSILDIYKVFEHITMLSMGIVAALQSYTHTTYLAQILVFWVTCGVNSLTAIRVLAGTKNSRPVGFYSRNSTKSTINPNTTIPQI
jgi:hypothetical protein